MRSYIVFFLLFTMVGVFGVMQGTRKFMSHVVKGQVPKDSAKGKGETKKSATAKAGNKSTKDGKEIKQSGKTETTKKNIVPRMKRPLRVVGIGWELIAGGIIANKGATPGKGSLFKKEQLLVHLKACNTLEEVEAALARGGGDKMGADVAVLPLPVFAAAYERLRALSPQIFFVAGWSRGQDGMMISPKANLRRPPKKRVDLIGEAGDPSTFLSLYILELIGLPPKKIRLIKADDRRAPKALFAAQRRPLSKDAQVGDRKFIVTTADTTHLIPIVAIAPKGFIEAHENALTVWGNVWTAGVEALNKDVPTAARQLAAMNDAPHTLELLKRLGQMDSATLIDNARLAGLSGRSAVTLEELFRRCWRIWRGVGAISSPLPERVPMSVNVMASMVRTYPTLVEALPAGISESKKKAQTQRNDRASLLYYQPTMRRFDKTLIVRELGMLGGIFSRAELRVSVRGNFHRSLKLVQEARQRYSLADSQRIKAVRRDKGKLVVIEVLTQQ